MRRHHCTAVDPCPACERDAEDRADAHRTRDLEPLDRYGRDADDHYPHGWGPM